LPGVHMGKPKFSWHRHVVIMSVINYFYTYIWEKLFVNTFYICSLFTLFTVFLKFPVNNLLDYVFRRSCFPSLEIVPPLLHQVTVTNESSEEDR